MQLPRHWPPQPEPGRERPVTLQEMSKIARDCVSYCSHIYNVYDVDDSIIHVSAKQEKTDIMIEV